MALVNVAHQRQETMNDGLCLSQTNNAIKPDLPDLVKDGAETMR